MNIGLITYEDGIMHRGYKPNIKAVIKFLDNYKVIEYYKKKGHNPVKIMVAGDNYRDLKQGSNLKEALEAGKWKGKVITDNVLIDRNGGAHELADYTVTSLKELSSLIREEKSYDIVLCDGDNTLWKSYLDGRRRILNHFYFLIEKNTPQWANNIMKTLTVMSENMLSLAQVSPRQLYKRKEDSLEDFLKEVKENKSFLIINSLSSELVIKRILNQIKSIKKSYIKNRVL